MAQAAAQQVDFGTRVILAATQGSVGAAVAASLSSVTEPIVNRILVERLTVQQALQHLSAEQIARMFNTALITNELKFPLYEVTSVIMQGREGLSPQLQGAATGAIFCTLTLPLTNYRYCKSVGAPIIPSTLYKAYLPTVLRDVVYGMARQWATRTLLAQWPDLPKTQGGKFFLNFFAVLAACLISAPGNEVRGYFLQPENKRLPVSQFFQPIRFLRSAIVGALIMSTAMGTGAVVTGPIQDYVMMLRSWMKNNMIETIVALFAVHQFLESSRSAALLEAQTSTVKALQQLRAAEDGAEGGKRA